MPRAAWVCNTCRTRKKGCDKALPRCGYCTQRNLVCVYYDTRPSETGELVSGVSEASTDFGFFSETLPVGDEISRLDEVIDLQVARVLNATHLSLHEIRERFFHGFHRWLPIIHPERFHEMTRQIYAGSSLRADDSVLLLAICLVALPPTPHLKQSIKPQALYLTIKALIAQAQAVLCASTPLIQASLIVSAYEYAVERQAVAYASVGLAVRLAQAIGLDKAGEKTPQPWYQVIEERNVWWGVVILERIILVETTIKARPTAGFPGPDTCLPLDLHPGNEAQQTPPLGSVHDSKIGSFGRHAQAGYWLDQVLYHTLSPETISPELEKLDKELRGLLTLVVDECNQVKELRCGVIATITRALTILHQYSITFPDPPTGSDHPQRRQYSQAMLNTVAKIVTDVADDHSKHMIPHDVDALPLCCAHTLRVARKHVENWGSQPGCQESIPDLEPLLALDRAFASRWRPTKG